MKLLLVEDDMTITAGLTYSLEQEGYEVTARADVRSAELAIADLTFDLYLLDLSLPDGTGYDLCRLIKSKSSAPVIFLTACDDEVNVVMGLDLGADDYITKPFRVRELLSRIKSVLRRCQKSDDGKSSSFLIRDIRINLTEAKVYKREAEVILTALEYRLLLTFWNHCGQVLSRGQLLEGIWDAAGSFVNDNTLTVYIKRLREKLEDDPQDPKLILTVRGLGYRMDSGEGGTAC